MVFGLVEHSFLVCLVSLQAELNGGIRAFALEPSRVLARSDHWTSFITLRRISGPSAYKEMAILKGHGYLFLYNFQTPMERWMHHFYSSEIREWFRLLGKTFRIIWPSKVKDNCGKSRFYPILVSKVVDRLSLIPDLDITSGLRSKMSSRPFYQSEIKSWFVMENMVTRFLLSGAKATNLADGETRAIVELATTTVVLPVSTFQCTRLPD